MFTHCAQYVNVHGALGSLVAMALGGAVYAFAAIAVVGLPIGLLVDRRRQLSPRLTK
jgi:hypothetical protein